MKLLIETTSQAPHGPTDDGAQYRRKLCPGGSVPDNHPKRSRIRWRGTLLQPPSPTTWSSSSPVRQEDSFQLPLIRPTWRGPRGLGGPPGGRLTAPSGPLQQGLGSGGTLMLPSSSITCELHIVKLLLSGVPPQMES